MAQLLCDEVSLREVGGGRSDEQQGASGSKADGNGNARLLDGETRNRKGNSFKVNYYLLAIRY